MFYRKSKERKMTLRPTTLGEGCGQSGLLLMRNFSENVIFCIVATLQVENLVSRICLLVLFFFGGDLF